VQQAQGGGSLLCEGVAVASFPTKSLVGTHLEKHCGVSSIRDGGNGNSLAHRFIWLSPMILCSVAAAVTVVVLAPKYAEQRELGSCSHNVSLHKRAHSLLAPNFAEHREVGSCSSLSDLINYSKKGQKND
jgi:hypothetical protein